MRVIYLEIILCITLFMMEILSKFEEQPMLPYLVVEQVVATEVYINHWSIRKIAVHKGKYQADCVHH